VDDVGHTRCTPILASPTRSGRDLGSSLTRSARADPAARSAASLQEPALPIAV